MDKINFVTLNDGFLYKYTRVDYDHKLDLICNRARTQVFTSSDKYGIYTVVTENGRILIGSVFLSKEIDITFMAKTYDFDCTCITKIFNSSRNTDVTLPGINICYINNDSIMILEVQIFGDKLCVDYEYGKKFNSEILQTNVDNELNLLVITETSLHVIVNELFFEHDRIECSFTDKIKQTSFDSEYIFMIMNNGKVKKLCVEELFLEKNIYTIKKSLIPNVIVQKTIKIDDIHLFVADNYDCYYYDSYLNDDKVFKINNYQISDAKKMGRYYIFFWDFEWKIYAARYDCLLIFNKDVMDNKQDTIDINLTHLSFFDDKSIVQINADNYDNNEFSFVTEDGYVWVGIFNETDDSISFDCHWMPVYEKIQVNIPKISNIKSANSCVHESSLKY